MLEHKGMDPLKLSISLLTPFRKGRPSVSQTTALSLREYRSCQQRDNNTDPNFAFPIYKSRYLFMPYRVVLSDLFL